MSNIDKRALRDLATALDGDDWHAEGNSVYGGAYDVGDNVCYDNIASCESVNGESPLADFIAAANPATVLALLDELEAAENRIAELEVRTLVPVEPTLDQLVAGKRRLTSTGRMSRLMSQRLAEVYRAMVSAAAAGKGE